MKNVLIALVFICSVHSSTAQVKIEMMAPEITLPNTKDSVVNLSSFRGKIVLIDFWASWCVPCRAANAGVVRLYNKYKAKGFEVFGVSVDNKKQAWVKAIAQDKIKYTQVNDKGEGNSSIAEKYGVNKIPTSFLLDRNGKIIAIDLEGKELENKLTELLD